MVVLIHLKNYVNTLDNPDVQIRVTTQAWEIFRSRPSYLVSGIFQRSMEDIHKLLTDIESLNQEIPANIENHKNFEIGALEINEWQNSKQL